MLLVSLLLAPAASAAEWRLGVLAGAGRDLPAVSSNDPTRFGFGPAVVAPLRWTGKGGASLRVGLELSGAPGQDVLDWQETSGGETYLFYSDAHPSSYVAARALVGPEFSLLPGRPVTPYMGAGAGGGVVGNFHELSGATAVLADDGAEGGLQTYTMQATWAAGAWLGVRVGAPGKVALEVEAGYCVSFLPEAPLQQSAAALEATRSAWSLDLARVSGGVSFPL